MPALDVGYTAEVTLAELQACADCIVSSRSRGGFSIVMPGFAGALQVKGMVEIQVRLFDGLRDPRYTVPAPSRRAHI